MTLKLLTTLPLIALAAGCVGQETYGGINEPAELERTLNEDLDGDGSIPTPIGVETSAPG